MEWRTARNFGHVMLLAGFGPSSTLKGVALSQSLAVHLEEVSTGSGSDRVAAQHAILPLILDLMADASDHARWTMQLKQPGPALCTCRYEMDPAVKKSRIVSSKFLPSITCAFFIIAPSS